MNGFVLGSLFIVICSVVNLIYNDHNYKHHRHRKDAWNLGFAWGYMCMAIVSAGFVAAAVYLTD